MWILLSGGLWLLCLAYASVLCLFRQFRYISVALILASTIGMVLSSVLSLALSIPFGLFGVVSGFIGGGFLGVQLGLSAARKLRGRFPMLVTQ